MIFNTSAGFVRHDVSGRLVPNSATLASDMDDAQLWDTFVHNPVASTVYEAPEIDIGWDAVGLRVWAEVGAVLGPGESGAPDYLIEIDRHDTGGVYDGFEPWTIGTIDARFVKVRVRLLSTSGVSYLSQFSPVVDVAEKTEVASGLTVAAGGTVFSFADLFGAQFHTTPAIQVSAASEGGAARQASWQGASPTGVTIFVYDGTGADVGGTVNLSVTGA